MVKSKVLTIDIETAPILAYVWGLFDQNIGINQIKEDWSVLSWAAKWQGSKEVMYMDQSKCRDVKNDKKLVKAIWKLLDEADIVVGQNSKRFDVKKLNARFEFYGFKPPRSFRQIDTLQLSKKHFAFTSNKLEYTSKLNKKYKKQLHKKYPGFELWLACLNGDQSAWKEIKKYNIYDVLSTEERYESLSKWDQSVVIKHGVCNCGSTSLIKNGYRYTNKGVYERLQCRKCGAESKGKKVK